MMKCASAHCRVRSDESPVPFVGGYCRTCLADLLRAGVLMCNECGDPMGAHRPGEYGQQLCSLCGCVRTHHSGPPRVTEVRV